MTARLHICSLLAKEVLLTKTGLIFMAMTAVLCATVPSADSPGTPRAQLHFAGQMLLEYQARQAKEAGVTQVIALVDVVTPPLSRMVDRLMTEGVRVQLVRDMPTLMRDIPKESDLLLFADGAIVGQQHIDAVVQAQGSAILVADDSSAVAHLERIDGVHRWCGVGKFSPDVVFNTLDLIGDWDLSLTLLRAAVQAGAGRITVPQSDLLEGHAAIVDRQATADLVAQALLTSEPADAKGGAGLEYYVMAPLARMLSGRMVRMQIPASQLRYAAVGLALMAMLALYPGWVALTYLLLASALVSDCAADQLANMGRRHHGDGWVARLPIAIILVGLSLIGCHYGDWGDAIYLALLAGVIHLAIRQAAGVHGKRWAYLTPGSALVLLAVGSLIGQFAALSLLAVVAAIASVGWLLLFERR